MVMLPLNLPNVSHQYRIFGMGLGAARLCPGIITAFGYAQNAA